MGAFQATSPSAEPSQGWARLLMFWIPGGHAEPPLHSRNGSRSCAAEPARLRVPGSSSGAGYWDGAAGSTGISPLQQHSPFSWFAVFLYSALDKSIQRPQSNLQPHPGTRGESKSGSTWMHRGWMGALGSCLGGRSSPQAPQFSCCVSFPVHPVGFLVPEHILAHVDTTNQSGTQ